MRTRAPLAWLAPVLLLLSACAGPAPRPAGEESWEQHRARLLALSDWHATGKLALRTSDMSESASLDWQQRGGHSQLQLSGPLGVNATTLYSDGDSLVIRRGEETHTVDLSDQRELEQLTGWDLPVRALPHWLKGVPDPDLAVQHMEFGEPAPLLQRLQQDDWEIDYQQYASFDRFTLPTRLTIRRAATTVRVILRDWQTELAR